MVKRYQIDTPDQLRALYALYPAGNPRMDCLARVWRAQDVLRSAKPRQSAHAQHGIHRV